MPQVLWQRWFGVGALAVALLLSLAGAVALPFVLPMLVVALVLMAKPRPLKPLPSWLENLLALVIVAAVAAGGGLRFGVMRPVANLLVLLTAVRLWGGAEKTRRATVLLLLAMLNAAGIASSTHPALVGYLVALLVGVVVAAGQLVPLELGQRFGGGSPRGLPPARLVAGTTVLAFLVAAPLFVLFPRLRSPFAASGLGARPVSGFREAVSLHQLGDIKISRRPMLRVRFLNADQVQPHWLRFAGATLSHYRAGRWLESRKQRAGEEVNFFAGPEGPVKAEITLEQSSDRLFLPPGTRQVVPPDAEVWVDGAEAVRIPRSLEPPISFRVSFDPGVVNTRPPGPEDLAVTVSRQALRRVAREAMGNARDPLRRAQALEEYLQRRYRYSTSTAVPLRADPVEWFLFTAREGHCEFFASAMVLLLRAEGIPARLQTGFAGGQDLGGGEFLLRDANAHAWVLAYIGDRWWIFDPTPPEGRPGTESGTEAVSLRALWANLEGFWDRWVITFSLADQLEVLVSLWSAVRSAGRWLALLAVALLVVAAAWLLWRQRGRQKRRAAPSELGVLLWRLAQEAGWDEESLARATPSQVLDSLLPRLSSSREACLWLFQAHERAVYAAGATPPRRRVWASFREVLRELRRPLPEADRTTSGPAPGSKAKRE